MATPIHATFNSKLPAKITVHGVSRVKVGDELAIWINSDSISTTFLVCEIIADERGTIIRIKGEEGLPFAYYIEFVTPAPE